MFRFGKGGDNFFHPIRNSKLSYIFKAIFGGNKLKKTVNNLISIIYGFQQWS